jgi:hypothetical protein
LFIPVSSQKKGLKAEKGVGFPLWGGNNSFAYLLSAKGRTETMEEDGSIPKPWLDEEEVENRRMLLPTEVLIDVQGLKRNEVTSSKRKRIPVQTVAITESEAQESIGTVSRGVACYPLIVSNISDLRDPTH